MIPVYKRVHGLSFDAQRRSMHCWTTVQTAMNHMQIPSVAAEGEPRHATRSSGRRVAKEANGLVEDVSGNWIVLRGSGTETHIVWISGI